MGPPALRDTLRRFFGAGGSGGAESAAGQVRALAEALVEYGGGLRLFSASVLVVCDAGAEGGFRVWLVDFAHSFFLDGGQGGADENVLAGLAALEGELRALG